MASVQNLFTIPMLWETKRTVVPDSRRSYMRWRAFFLKAAPPAGRDRRGAGRRRAGLAPVGRALGALLLEGRVARRESLVEDEDVRLHVHGDGEAQAGLHPAGGGPFGAGHSSAQV